MHVCLPVACRAVWLSQRSHRTTKDIHLHNNGVPPCFSRSAAYSLASGYCTEKLRKQKLLVLQQLPTVTTTQTWRDLQSHWLRNTCERKLLRIKLALQPLFIPVTFMGAEHATHLYGSALSGRDNESCSFFEPCTGGQNLIISTIRSIRVIAFKANAHRVHTRRPRY